ncbi:MAG: hypothetical protein P4L31_07550 [Candidatus Babeliales bacterium]|nr:hypothetical protein [Candidatus Babeliales bacterium]
METQNNFGPAAIRKSELKDFGIILVIAFKADDISLGNFQNRKDERSCSLETFNNPNSYKKYKN